MVSEFGRSSGVVRAALLFTAADGVRSVYPRDVWAIAGKLQTNPGRLGPFTGRANLREPVTAMADVQFRSYLRRMAPDDLCDWPGRDLTFALSLVIVRMARADRGGRIAGTRLLVALSRERPNEVMHALEIALTSGGAVDSDFGAVIRGLRRALPAPPAGGAGRPPRRPPFVAPRAPGKRAVPPVHPSGIAPGGPGAVRIILDPSDMHVADIGSFGSGSGGPARVDSDQADDDATGAADDAGAGTTPAAPLYPVVKVNGPGGRRQVVVAGTPFTVDIGFGPRAVGLIARTSIEIPAGVTTLTVRLLYDPNSLTVQDSEPLELKLAIGPAAEPPAFDEARQRAHPRHHLLGQQLPTTRHQSRSTTAFMINRGALGLR